MRLSVLGSGSTGNSTLLMLREASGERCVLVDCGLGPRVTARRLAAFDLGLDDVSAILLTHLDRDHCAHGWARVSRTHGIAVHLHERHRSRALADGFDGTTMCLFRDGFRLAPATAVEPLMLAHDALGAVGYVVEHDGLRLGYATDLGCVPTSLRRVFVDLHALAIESNYDVDLQVGSDRPEMIKRRVMGGRGHLSNEQALDAVIEIARGSALTHLVLLHLSRDCNDPSLVRRLYAERAPHLLDRLTIAAAHDPTPLLEVTSTRSPLVGRQMSMFG